MVARVDEVGQADRFGHAGGQGVTARLVKMTSLALFMV